MSVPHHLVLIGPTGAGKTSIGRLLAQALQRDFTDLDRLIEQQVGTDIATIFWERDENYFRDRETAALRDALRQDESVIATGAGCILRQENRDLLAANAYVVYLALDLQEQERRLQRDRTRPLLQTEDRERVLREMAAIRTPLYVAAADFTYAECTQRSPKGVCAQLLTQLRQAWHD